MSRNTDQTRTWCLLEYYMDEVIPYKNAYYRQFMDLELAEDASVDLDRWFD